MAEIPPTRASLLVRLRDPRDQAAWTEFIALYGPLVYNYARKQGLQDADAADLGQEVLRAVASGVGRLEYDPSRGSFRNWLFTVVRRKLSTWRSARGNRVRGSGDSATQQLLEQCPAPATDEAEWEDEWEDQVFSWACASPQGRRGLNLAGLLEDRAGGSADEARGRRTRLDHRSRLPGPSPDPGPTQGPGPIRARTLSEPPSAATPEEPS